MGVMDRSVIVRRLGPVGLLAVALCAGALPARAGAPASPYAWEPTATDRLDARFPAPTGFARVDVEPGGFGAFLRGLPLAPAGTPVVDYRGRVVLQGDDSNLAAVVDIDVGGADLQQCADSILRLDAEWRYGRGDHKIAYPIASGAVLAYSKYLAGERAIPAGRDLLLRRAAAPSADDHRALRSYLDEVFTWANTRSLEHEGAAVPYAEVRPGDYFVSPGQPFGHAVLVLDVARDTTGHVALLLGQGFMPAQSFHVLRPSERVAWFIGRTTAEEIATPFYRPFPATALRRLP